MNLRSLAMISVVLLVSACAAADDGAADSTEAGTGTMSTSTTATESSSGAGIETSSSAGVDDSSSSAADSSSSSGGGVCTDEAPAIVTDIDETLTLADEEFFMQIMDPTYDPIEREGGAALINGYADLGYRIMYLTARGENVDIIGSEETAREITVRWLEEHGYPLDPETTTVVLAPMLLVGAAAQEYKAGALADQQALGWRFDYAYGNATTDIGAYEDAGIDKAETFIIGEHAGEEGTVAIEGEDWLAHTAEQLPMVPAVCEAA